MTFMTTGGWKKSLKEWIEKHFKYTDDIMISENDIAFIQIWDVKLWAMTLDRGWISKLSMK